MSCHPSVLLSSGSPTSPLLRTCTMSGGGETDRACVRMCARLSRTVPEVGMPMGGGASMDV